MKNSYTKFWLLKLLTIFLCMVVSAPAATEAQDTEEKKIMTDLQRKMQKPITVNFKQTPIEDVITLIAEKADVDVIKSPEVANTFVTATLTSVPLEEALKNILAAHGFAHVVDEHMIRVLPADQVKPQVELENIVSRIYRITYADVTEVEKTLKKFISKEYGSLSANVGTSNIIVSDIESRIKAIDTFIEEIDRITPQILVETRIYDVTSKDRLDLGVDWRIGRNTSYGTDGVAVVDGTSGTVSTLTNAGGSRTDPHLTGKFSGLVNEAADTTAALRFGILNSSLNIDAVLRAEQENVNAKLLANPRILVLDNETAEIKIVTEQPYQQIYQGGGTTITFGTTEFKEIGVSLEVTPHLTRDSMIRLQLKPKFSVQTGTVNVGTGGTTIGTTPQPIVDTREAYTTLLIEDGQTIVLGGLRKREIAQQINKVPLLGDMPLLGVLFKFEGEETIDSELVVFVTPHLVNGRAMSQDETNKYRATEFSGPEAPMSRFERSKE